MAFTVKLADYNDVEEASRVESETMGNYTYLKDGWHYFNSLKGGLVCISNEEKMIGIGRLSVLYDGSGWLECLRVVPEYQRQGAGKMIYDKYLEIAKENNCPSIAMYTGEKNVKSGNLAEIYGLKTVAMFRGYTLTDFTGGAPHHFHPVNWIRAEELIMAQKEKYHGFISLNRTFYHINPATAKGLAIEGKVYEDEETNSFIVCGARFQHHACLHIAMMEGDIEKCLEFAKNLAIAQGVNKIMCTFTLEHEELESLFIRHGFTPDKGNIIVKERTF